MGEWHSCLHTPLNPRLELWSVVLIIRLEALDISGEGGFIRSWQGMVRIVLLKVLLPLAIVGGGIVMLIVLHLDGTLREFLDGQSMLGMIAVVLALNIFGFASIYMLAIVWNTIRHNLLHYHDP